MVSVVAVAVFAIGASAQVPHWMKQKPQVPPSIANMQRKLMQQNPHGRRMQAIMSEECNTACPGVKAMVEAMMSERRLDGHGEMMKYCDHIGAMKCMATETKCQDEGADEPDMAGLAMIECLCACPKIAELGEDSMEQICKDKPGTVGCISSTAACSTMAKDMNTKEIDLGCLMIEKDCETKSKEMMTCVGEDDMKTYAEKCVSEKDGLSADTAVCCPLAKETIDCMGKDCMMLSMAMGKIAAEKEGKEEDEGAAEARKACPDIGIPSEAAVDATASSGTVSSGGAAASTDTAAQGQAVSMLAVAAVMSLALMA